MSFDSFLSDFEKAKSTGKSFVTVTLVSAKGSTPQVMGARMIVSRDGHFSGTVGGGKIEAAAIESAIGLLLSANQEGLGQSHFYREWNLQTDLGMSCGGTVGLFFETYVETKNWNLYVFGAGHVAQEVVRLLSRLDCKVTCVDSRADWLEKLPNDPKLTRVHHLNMAEAADTIRPDDFVVICTMGHSTDLPILDRLLKRIQPRYLGVIGSTVKSHKIRDELRKLSVDQSRVDGIVCPMGEDFGNNQPAEIALSIVAQLIKRRDQ